jgi:hypothetical protein
MGNNLREKHYYVFFARNVPDMGYQPWLTSGRYTYAKTIIYMLSI